MYTRSLVAIFLGSHEYYMLQLYNLQIDPARAVIDYLSPISLQDTVEDRIPVSVNLFVLQ